MLARRRGLIVGATLLLAGSLVPAAAAAADDTPTAPDACAATGGMNLTWTQTASFGRQFDAAVEVDDCATGSPLHGTFHLAQAADGSALSGKAMIEPRSYELVGYVVPASHSVVPLLVTFTPAGGGAPQTWPVTVTTTDGPTTTKLDASFIGDSGAGTISAKVVVVGGPSRLDHFASLLPPTGSVDLLADGVVVATAPLTPGTSTTTPSASARVTLPAADLGKSLTARYRGDAGYDVSTSSPGATVVDDRVRPTTTTAVDLWNGHDVSVTSSYSVPEVVEAIPTTMNVSVDGKVVRTGDLDGYPWFEGTLEQGWTPIPLGVGKHTITVSVPGSYFVAPASSTRTVTVVPARSAVAVTTSTLAPPPRAGHVGLSATVTLSGQRDQRPVVRFDRRLAGSTTWKTIATVRTDSQMQARTVTTQYVSSVYRAVVLPGAYVTGSTSRSVTLTTDRRVAVSQHASSDVRKRVITAVASPAGRVELEERTGHGWVVRRVATPHVATGARGSVSFTVTRPTNGSRLFRVVVHRDGVASGVVSSNVIVQPRH